jgi:hypothetical protein
MRHAKAPVAIGTTEAFSYEDGEFEALQIVDSTGEELLLVPLDIQSQPEEIAKELTVVLNLFDRMVDALEAQADRDICIISGRVQVVAETQADLDHYLLRAQKARALRSDALALLRRLETDA